MAEPIPPTPAPAPPPLVRPAAGQVAIADPDGSVSLIDEANLDAAGREGARPATEAEYVRAKMGAGGTIASATIGAGRGASFGLLDPAAIEVSRLIGGDAEAEDTRHALNIAKEAHPDATFGGEIVGSLAGLAMMPGGAVGAEARGASMLARAGSRAIATAPRAFVEGVFMGEGQQLSEDALGDHEMVGENYIAAGLEGGALNLLLGAGAHVAGGAAADLAGKGLAVAGRGARAVAGRLSTVAERLSGAATETGESAAKTLAKVTGADIEALAERQFGYAPEGLGERVRQKLVKASAGIAGKDEAIVDRLTQLGAEGREARRIAVFDGEKELEAATTEFRRAGDDMIRANKLTTAEFQGELKAEKIAGAVKRGNEAEVVSYARQQIAKAIEIAEGELTHADGVAPQAVKSLEGIARKAYHADAEIVKLAEAGVEDLNERVFMHLDGVKRDTQRWVSGGYNGIGKIADPFEARLAERSVRALDSYQNVLRSGLEDAEMFGKAGEIQKAINAEWTIQIDASNRFNKALTTEVGRDPTNPFRQLRGIDPTKADTYARNLVNPAADLTHQAVKDYVESTERLATVLRDNVSLPGPQAAEVNKIIASAQRFKAATAKAEKTLTLTNQYKQLTANSKDGLGVLAGMLGLSLGPLGTIAGAAAGSLANPGRIVAQLAAVERMGAKLDEKIKSGALAFMRGSKDAAKGVDATSAGAQKATRAVTTELVRAMREGARSPAAIAQRISEKFVDLRHAAPRVAQAAATTIMRMATYIAMAMPKERTPKGFQLVARKPEPLPPTELERVRAAVEVFDDPTVVIDALYAGRLNREHINALKFIYPKIYAKVRGEILALAQQEPWELTMQQEAGISILFGKPVSAMMQPQTVRGFTATFAQGAEPQGQAGGPAPSRPLGKGRSSLASAFDRTEAP